MSMDAIETLMNEHRVIEQVLDALVGFADEVRRKGTTEKEELARFVSFVREFADAYHHGKEEDVLFTTMVEHGFPREGGPVAVMLHEHDQGRALVRALAAKTTQHGAWTEADRQDIADGADAFANLLHAHIHKEDAILYPMAEQRLPASALERVGEACDALDREPSRVAVQERHGALASALVERYARAAHPGERPQRAGCCG
jgi:hemerythrin-like domain-containing protein